MKNYSNLIREKTNIEVQNVLEIGSCNGGDANFLKKEFGLNDDNIFVVEPNPTQIKLIERLYPGFKIIRKAVYNKPGKMKFNAVQDNNFSGSSSLLNRPDNLYFKVWTKVVEVDVITGKDLMSQVNQDIDMCKLDVEGATYEVLESLGDSINKIKSFHLESEHVEIWQGQKLYKETKKMLESAKFIEIYFKYVNGIERQSDSIWVHKDYLK